MYNSQVGRTSRSPINFFVIILFLGCLAGFITSDRARLNTMKYTFNRDLINMSGTIDSKGDLNLDFELFKPLDTIYMRGTSFHNKNNKKSILFNRSLNICRTFKMNAASPFVLGLVKIMKKTTNMSLTCPIKAGQYYTHGFNLKTFNLPGRAMGFPKNIFFETILLRDKLKDEKANSEDGKILLTEVTIQVTLIR